MKLSESSESNDEPAETTTPGQQIADPARLEDPSTAAIARPSVMHLLMCTTFSAVYLAIMRTHYSADAGSSPQVLQASIVVSAVLMGVLCTGTVLLLSERLRRGPPVMRQPGHWLLLVPTLLVCASLAYFAVQGVVFDAPFHEGSKWDFGVFTFIYAIGPLLYFTAALRSGAGVWRILFLGSAVAGIPACIAYASFCFISLGTGTYEVVFWLSEWSSRIIAVAVFVFALVEWFVGIRRDWLHWAGVVTLAAAASAEVLTKMLVQTVN